MARITILVVAVLVLFAGQSARAEGWQTAAFSNQLVTFVAVNDQDPNQLATIANSHLQLSTDNGVSWRAAALPAAPRSVTYDLTREGTLYAATDRGVYSNSQDK